MRFIVADRRECVTLAVPSDTAAGGTLTIRGKFPVARRMLELTDAQAALFEPALADLVAAKVLYAPAGWPAPKADPAEAELLQE